MLCYVMLCYVMLCYVMLCYVMLCYVMLCYVMLCYVMLCYVMLLVLMNHLHDFSHLRQTVQSCISCSLWPNGPAPVVTTCTSHVCSLLLVAHVKLCKQVKITRQRKILPGNRGACWMRKGKCWTGIIERHHILFVTSKIALNRKVGAILKIHRGNVTENLYYLMSHSQN